MASERQANAENSPWWGEHLHRYEVVEKALANSDSVLDLACGTGYGASRLSQHTQGRVVGGDLSEEAVRECTKNWQSFANLTFRVLDGTRIDFPDNFFDKVVSFETIEHTSNFEKMLHELNRVLKPHGTAFISTPNFPVNSPTGVVTNPHHVQEFTFEQFRTLAFRHFRAPQIFGQKFARYAQNDSWRTRLAATAEETLYRRGVRKLPMKLQDSLMGLLIGKPLYPKADDFTLVEAEAEVRKCKTFFAICEKK